jgi:hypothetical protein
VVCVVWQGNSECEGFDSAVCVTGSQCEVSVG